MKTNILFNPDPIIVNILSACMYEPGYADTLRAGERWPGCPCSNRLSMFLCSTTWRFKVKLVAVLVYHTQEADNSAGARISCTNSSFVLPCAQASNCIIVTKWVVAVVEDWSCLQYLQVLQVLGCLSHFPDTSCIFLANSGVNQCSTSVAVRNYWTIVWIYFTFCI